MENPIDMVGITKKTDDPANDMMMFNCIKSALLYFIQETKSDGVGFNISGVHHRLTIEPEGLSLTLSSEGEGDVEITEEFAIAEPNDRQSNIFRGFMCMALNYFIPRGWGIVVEYNSNRYIVGNQNGSNVFVQALDGTENFSLYDKIKMIFDDEDDEDEASTEAVENDFAPNAERPKYLN